MQNEDFGANFCADVRVQNVTWTRDRWSDFRKQKMRKTWKEKTHEKACRNFAADFVQGGGGGSR